MTTKHVINRLQPFHEKVLFDFCFGVMLLLVLYSSSLPNAALRFSPEIQLDPGSYPVNVKSNASVSLSTNSIDCPKISYLIPPSFVSPGNLIDLGMLSLV